MLVTTTNPVSVIKHLWIISLFFVLKMQRNRALVTICGMVGVWSIRTRWRYLIRTRLPGRRWCRCPGEVARRVLHVKAYNVRWGGSGSWSGRGNSYVETVEPSEAASGCGRSEGGSEVAERAYYETDRIQVSKYLSFFHPFHKVSVRYLARFNLNLVFENDSHRSCTHSKMACFVLNPSL